MFPVPTPYCRPQASRVLLLLTALLLPTCTGCILGRPNQENIRLRKQVQDTQDKVTALEQQHQADQNVIHALQTSTPSVPTLASERLAQLFTTHGLKFGRLTGGADLNRDKPGDEGIKIYVVPTDQDGQALKAAGAFKIELFDLARPEAPLLGTWMFDVNQSKQNWYGSFLDYTYAFSIPWKQVPAHPDLTVRVHFTEALTGLTFDAQQQIKVQLPPAGSTQPTTQPATHP